MPSLLPHVIELNGLSGSAELRLALMHTFCKEKGIVARMRSRWRGGQYLCYWSFAASTDAVAFAIRFGGLPLFKLENEAVLPTEPLLPA
jgi:hypothetical protein